MPIGVPKDPNYRHQWNGSGMTALSPEQRVNAMKNAAALQRERNKGWPDSIQKENDETRETYEAADAEWSRRMLNSKWRAR
mgnify:CR=1 FL=1